ncbi:MAG: metal-sensitive transcriptional regulator [Chloroflexi bacterium]|nr:metal-sensitive transcriptional regulator [Chloroflexota bacterium]
MPVDAPAVQADLVRRLRCAEGHLRGIAAMIERGDDCQTVIHQTLAVQAAIREINRRLLAHHLEHCLFAGLRDSDAPARERLLSDIVSLYQLVDAHGRWRMADSR